MHDIARFIISYKTRIVWAVFRCHRMTISLIDFFSAQKMWDPKNENARKLLAFKHLKNKIKCFRPNNVVFFHSFIIYYPNIHQIKVICHILMNYWEFCSQKIKITDFGAEKW